MKQIIALILLFVLLLVFAFMPDSQSYALVVYNGAEVQLSLSFVLGGLLLVGFTLLSVAYIFGRFRQWLRGSRLFTSQSKQVEIIFAGDEWKYLKTIKVEDLTVGRGKPDDSATALCMQGKALWQNRQFAQALDAFEKALKLQPKQALFYIPYIECLLDSNDTEAALVWLRKLKKLGNITSDYIAQAEARAYKIQALNAADDLKLQQSSLEKANGCAPQNLEIVMDLFRCYQRQNKEKAGKILIEAAWKYNQTKELMLLYVEGAKDSWEILSRVQRLVSFAPHSPYGLYLNVWAHLNVGNFGPAKALMNGSAFEGLSVAQRAHLELVAEIVEGSISREKLRTMSVLSLLP